jgi:peptide/nickel transport system permease protein
MGIKTLIARRVILAVPVMLGVVTLIFVALSAMTPAMRVAYYAGSSPRDWSPQKLRIAIHELGLDQPIVVQYVNWLGRIVRLDFGRSFASVGEEGAPVLQTILVSLPSTLELILYSVPFIIAFSIWLGTKAAINHNKQDDYIIRVFVTLGSSFPVFVVGGLLIMLCLAIQNPYQLHLDPYLQLSYDVGRNLSLRIEHGTFAQYTGMISIDALLNGDVWLFLDAMMHLILPVATLVLTQCAALVRVTRSGLLEELGKPYVAAAMAKGLSKKETVYKHARKNASISILTMLGLLMSNMFMSIVIVEEVFMRPGFGSLLVSSALTMNAPVLLTAAMFVALFFVLVNLIVDILYEYVDPRITLG